MYEFSVFGRLSGTVIEESFGKGRSRKSGLVQLGTKNINIQVRK